jgi:hypothetical protein
VAEGVLPQIHNGADVIWTVEVEHNFDVVNSVMQFFSAIWQYFLNDFNFRD